MATSNPNRASRPTAAAQAAAASYAKSISGVHPNYQVILEVEGDPAVNKDGVFPLIANLPERYHIDFSSQWSNPFAKDYIKDAAGAVSPVLESLVSIGSSVTGVSTKLKSQSVQVWESSSPLTFSIDLVFVAKTNSMNDIKKKHLALLKLAAPSELDSGTGAGQVLIQPGPVIVNSGLAPNTRKISMALGNYLYLDNVIVTSVSSDVSSICDEAGIPQHMVINLGVSSFYACFTTQDLEAAFNMASPPVQGK